MNKRIRPLMLLLLPALASCGGFSLDYIAEGNKYISYDFRENFYEHWDEELKNAQEVAPIDTTDSLIMSFNDIGQVDKNYLTTPTKDLPSLREFAKSHSLMSYDQSFYYGVQSKLFDGEAYCDGYYQRHRVQSNDKGFSVRFSKESDELTYIAVQFKTTTNNQIDCYPVGKDYHINAEKEHKDSQLFHSSSFDLKVTVYTKEDSKIIGHPFVTTITNNNTNDGSVYYFYAFDLEQYNLSRMVGFSITYSNLDDELINWNKDKKIDDKPVETIDYALFVYEVLLPYTYWH